MSNYEAIDNLVGNRLVRYCGSGWGGGLGIRVVGQSQYYIDELVKSITVRLMNGTELTLIRDAVNCKEFYFGDPSYGLQTDFVCEYDNPVTGKVDKFSLFKYLDEDYNMEDISVKDKYTSNYVLVTSVNPNKMLEK